MSTKRLGRLVSRAACPPSPPYSTSTTHNNWRGWRNKSPHSPPPSTNNFPRMCQMPSSTLLTTISPPTNASHAPNLAPNRTPNQPLSHPPHTPSHPQTIHLQNVRNQIHILHKRVFGRGHIVHHSPRHNTNASAQRDTGQHTTMAGGETSPVSYHIQHVHERRAIGFFFHEHARRKATNKNRDKKHYRQQIMNHTNNSLIVNLTHQELEPPLTSMLAKGLKFVPTPNQTSLKTIVNSFKQFRQTMYTHYHFRNSSNNHSHPFKTTSVWKPPLPDNPSLLSYICSVAESIHHTFSHNSHDQSTSNLTKRK